MREEARREGSWPTEADKRFVKGGKLVGKKSNDEPWLSVCSIGSSSSSPPDGYS